MLILEISDVSFRWPGAPADTLDIAQFSIGKGQHTFLSGPSGCGKSTLLNLISGVIIPRSGSLSVVGNDLARESASGRDRIRANNIGYIFQQFNLVPYLSAMENVVLPCRFSRSRRDRAVERSGDVEREGTRLLAALFPHGIPGAGDRVSQLSVGQQQRVAAARALMGRPELMIADEPTSALDPDSRERFMDLLMSEADAADVTMLFVSHDPALRDHFPRQLTFGEINRVSSA